MPFHDSSRVAAGQAQAESAASAAPQDGQTRGTGNERAAEGEAKTLG